MPPVFASSCAERHRRVRAKGFRPDPELGQAPRLVLDRSYGAPRVPPCPLTTTSSSLAGARPLWSVHPAYLPGPPFPRRALLDEPATGAAKVQSFGLLRMPRSSSVSLW